MVSNGYGLLRTYDTGFLFFVLLSVNFTRPLTFVSNPSERVEVHFFIERRLVLTLAALQMSSFCSPIYASRSTACQNVFCTCPVHIPRFLLVECVSLSDLLKWWESGSYSNAASVKLSALQWQAEKFTSVYVINAVVALPDTMPSWAAPLLMEGAQRQ